MFIDLLKDNLKNQYTVYGQIYNKKSPKNRACKKVSLFACRRSDDMNHDAKLITNSLSDKFIINKLHMEWPRKSDAFWRRYSLCRKTESNVTIFDYDSI